MSETAELKTKHVEYKGIPPQFLYVEEGFNVRQDMGDLEELMISIVEQGLQQPLIVKKVEKEDRYKIIDGHRRFAAIQLAIERGHDIRYVDARPVKWNEEQQLLAMMITGVGQKQLTEIEQAEGIQKLINFGYKVEQIATKIGKSVPHVYSMISLANAPKIIKDQVHEGAISGSAVTQIIRETKDEKEQLDRVKKATEVANAETLPGEKPKKATAKHVAGIKTKSTDQRLMETLTFLADNDIDNEKTHLLEELIDKLASKKTPEEIAELFRN